MTPDRVYTYRKSAWESENKKEEPTMTLKEALNNEEIANKFDSAESMDDIIATLKEYGVEATEEEVMSAIAEEGGELTEDQLENVAGGSIITSMLIGLGARKLLELIRKKKIKPINLPKTILRMLGL